MKRSARASLVPCSVLAVFTRGCVAEAEAKAEADASGGLGHDTVNGAFIEKMHISAAASQTETESVEFSNLSAPRAPGRYTIQVSATGNAIRIPHCNGRGVVSVDGAVRDNGSKGPLIVPLGADKVHTVRFDVVVSPYEKRIACGERVRAGDVVHASEGISLLRFASTHKGPNAGEAVVFVPRGHDMSAPGPLLVGLHPWNGGPWTYAAYRELLEQAQARDVTLLMPSGLGNSLYTSEAEDEVLQAIDALGREMAVDRSRVSVWGASMGGQGATTVAFHQPDRFAFVASYFGDARFDRSTYVRALLPTDDAAHKINPIDVVDNARHLATWLIHGEADRTSPVVQSTMLFEALRARQFTVDFDRVPLMGHEGPLVVTFIRRVVDRAAEARAPSFPARVSFRSTRAGDTEAYGVAIQRASASDAFLDIELREDGVYVLQPTAAISRIVLRPGALGAREGCKVHIAKGVTATVEWRAK